MDARSPKSLLVVTQWYRPELIGTAFYSTEMAEWFAKRGTATTVLTNRPSYPGNEVFPEYRDGARDIESLDGVTVRRLATHVARGGGAKARIMAEILFLLRGVAALVRHGLWHRSHVVSFCPSVMAVLLGWLARGRGGRHVAVVHDIQSGLAAGLNMVGNPAFLRLMRGVEVFCLNRADALIALSDQMRDALVAIGVKRPISVLPIWVDVDRIHPTKRSRETGPTILYSGVLGRKQGLNQILDLAEVLGRERPDIRILVRGGGSQEEEFKTTARDRGLENIAFEPLVPMDRFNEGLADGDVHLVPQNPDAADFAVPSKVYNILAAGRPFVCTAREGSSLWTLCQRSGAFVCTRPDDPRAFASAVTALIDDPERLAELGARGREYVEAHVARDVVLNRYGDLVGGAR